MFLSTILLADGLDWFIGISFLVLVALLVFGIRAIFGARRTDAKIAKAAPQLGFAYIGNAFSDPAAVKDFGTQLFSYGTRKAFHNIMTGDAGGMPAAVFDWSYVIDSRTKEHTWRTFRQTVASFARDGVAIPTFAIAPAGLMTKLGDKVFGRGIEFPEHPQLTNRFHVYGDDEAAVRALFTPTMFALLDSVDLSKQFHIEGSGRTLFVYRQDHLVAAKDLKGFVSDTAALAQAFFAGVTSSKQSG